MTVYSMFKKDPYDIYVYLKGIGFFPNRKGCRRCGREMTEVDRDDALEKCGWRCKCGTRETVRKGTFLEGRRLPIEQFVEIVHHTWTQRKRPPSSSLQNRPGPRCVQLAERHLQARWTAFHDIQWLLGGLQSNHRLGRIWAHERQSLPLFRRSCDRSKCL